MKKRIAVLFSAFALTVLLNNLSVLANEKSNDPNTPGPIAISPMCILDEEFEFQ